MSFRRIPDEHGGYGFYFDTSEGSRVIVADEIRKEAELGTATVSESCARCEGLRASLGEVLDTLPELVDKINTMSRDELTVMNMLADKMMGEGIEEHGALDVATDSRTTKDIMSECLDEFFDSFFYSLVKRMRVERGLK